MVSQIQYYSKRNKFLGNKNKTKQNNSTCNTESRITACLSKCAEKTNLLCAGKRVTYRNMLHPFSTPKHLQKKLIKRNKKMKAFNITGKLTYFARITISVFSTTNIQQHQDYSIASRLIKPDFRQIGISPYYLLHLGCT